MRLTRDSRHAYWLEVVKEWESCEETQAEFCERKGISFANFSKWRQRFKNENQKFIKANIVDNAPVNNGSDAECIHYRKGDVEIKIPLNCTASQLKTIFNLVGL